MTILTINFEDYLFHKDSDAAKILSLMAGVVRMRPVHFAGRTVYYPYENQPEISIRLIGKNQLFAEDPTKRQEPSGPRQLNPAKP